MMYEVGDVVGGFGDQDGVTLNIISSIVGDKISITVEFYGSDHPDFTWAVSELQKVQEDI